MENTQDTPATTEAPAKRKYVRRTPEERIAALEAQKARILAETKVSPDVKVARRSVASLYNAAEKVTDASIAAMLRGFADDLNAELDSFQG